MKFKYSDLFTYFTGLLIFLSFFEGWFFIFTAILTGSIALIYDAFQKKDLHIRPLFIIGHFILTVACIYISYFSFKLFLTTTLQLLKARETDIQAFRSLIFPVLLDTLLFILSLVLFISGLFKAKKQ